jgi:hypothetical protein
MDIEERALALEARIDGLEARKKACLHELKRASAAHEVANLMAKFMLWQCRHDDPDLPSMRDAWKLFADRSDCTLEIEDWGVYKSIGHIRKWFEKFGAVRPYEGVMFTHTLTSPAIVVAGDGQTARAIWQSPGHETDPRIGPDGGSEDSKPVAAWVWGRVEAAFIKERGTWKIWHYHFYLTFRSPFYTAWSDNYATAIQTGGPRNNPAYNKYDLPEPDGETSFHNPYTAVSQLIPVPDCPAPYETWTDELPWPSRSKLFLREQAGRSEEASDGLIQ